MEDLGILGIISVVSFFSTEVIKNILHIAFAKVKVGIIISVIINLAFTLSLGYGLVYYATNISYSTYDIPALFKYTDIITTALLLTVVSKFANSALEKKGINISGMVKSISEQAEETFDKETTEAITNTLKKYKYNNEEVHSDEVEPVTLLNEDSNK